MDNKGQNIENKNMDDKLPADDEKDELPDYEDDEDFKRLMNEALMRNMNRLENESKIVQASTIKQKKIKNKQINNNISLGSFMKAIDKTKPKVFVSKRKQDKFGIQSKRVFNPKKPPYLLVNKPKYNTTLDENNFPSL
jgi:hypothetical protein